MNLPFRTTLALTLLLLAAVPAPAQDADAWVLPRGRLEFVGTGVFTHYDRRLGGGDLGRCRRFAIRLPRCDAGKPCLARGLACDGR